MNAGSTFSLNNGLDAFTREQVVKLARMAGLTPDDLIEPRPVILKDTPTERHIELVGGEVVRVLKTQDRKYGVRVEQRGASFFAQLANLETAASIPEDEPVMIFRGKDVHAIAAISEYLRVVTADSTSVSPQTIETAHGRFMAFSDFAKNNPDRMRAPT